MANNGKQGEALFQQRMSSLNYQVQDVSNDSSYWEKDIDFIITSPTSGLTKTFECKWDSRINRTGNLYLELFNINSKGGRGWWKFCKADYVAYGDALAQVFYIFPLAQLRERVEKIGPRLGRCGNDSEGFLVSLDEVKDLIGGLI